MQLTDTKYIDEIERFYSRKKLAKANVKIVFDPSIPMRFRQELLARDFKIQGADNRVLDGIGEVSNLLGLDKFYILKGECPNAELEFVTYAWDKRAQQKGEDKPLKEYDHCMDDIRYAANEYAYSGGVTEFRGFAV